MQVDTNVSEGDVGGVRLNEKATFSVDAFPDRTFEGVVVQVRQSPQTVQNVVTYDVVVGVTNTDLSLKPGMTAAVRIITDARTNVRRVPNQALRYRPTRDVTTDPSGPHIWVLRDGKPVMTHIKVGLSDDNFTEIESGELQAADQIIVGERTTQNRAALSAPRF
jgi:HlyD family secretion protein